MPSRLDETDAVSLESRLPSSVHVEISSVPCADADNVDHDSGDDKLKGKDLDDVNPELPKLLDVSPPRGVAGAEEQRRIEHGESSSPETSISMNVFLTTNGDEAGDSDLSEATCGSTDMDTEECTGAVCNIEEAITDSGLIMTR